MKKSIRWLLTLILVCVAIIAVGYAGYKIYDYLITDATKRIEQGVEEGASKGIGKGVGGILNPINLFSPKN